MNFSDVFRSIEPDKLKLELYSKTERDVRKALVNPQGNIDALIALLSPAATPFIEQMAQLSASLTRQRFGANLALYLPLYVSNLCANECDYCGFTMSNKIKRKTLNQTELQQEIDIIKAKGFDHVLLVSGEHETKVGIDYFEAIFAQVKSAFSHVAIEVQPLKQDEYARLNDHGLDAVMIYQETYQQRTYARHHTRGKKQDFSYRLDTPDRIARAGVDKIGLGVLLGLDDWRLDALLMGHHLAYLEQKYWRTKYSISLPRLRPCTGGITPKSEISDLGLVQLICAFRLFNQQLEISLSTRETPELRDNLLGLGVTNLSAESSTEPGGYANPQSQLDQFEISDDRSTQEIVQVMKAKGFQPVWKDWEAAW
ncbi:2-iminoacetate synthase ThiH [Shewanella maritima]|uniref:2-iminoacetate synthase ThiH n=1 Tax=Shewanella maritima TaxID=2520507 RepID=A0A411PMH9_9GAMM|nr:2-iminoacetate synthase ThiH [Shewanella maritima]QBF84716.1 2-iminoacetate synthase ThiH [Shewanella maritima]